MSLIAPPLTLAKLKEVKDILDAQPLPDRLITADDPDTEMVEFCGFKFVQKKKRDHEKVDIAKWAKRMGIRYLPQKDDSVWLT